MPPMQGTMEDCRAAYQAANEWFAFWRGHGDVAEGEAALIADKVSWRGCIVLLPWGFLCVWLVQVNKQYLRALAALCAGTFADNQTTHLQCWLNPALRSPNLNPNPWLAAGGSGQPVRGGGRPPAARAVGTLAVL